MNNSSFKTIMLWIFWIIGIVTLFLISIKLYDNDNDFIKVLPAFGILLSAFIASLSIMKTIENTNNLEKKKNENEISRYYVDKCTEGFEIVYDLLKDQNNNPSTWIEAARILKYSLELSDNIKTESYKKIYQIKVFQYRHILLKILTDDYGNSLKTTFFFGIKEWETVDVEGASNIAESNNRSCGSIGCYDVAPYPKGAYINESALKVVFDFISYEESFYDPLEKEKINDLETWKEQGGISIIKEGACKYLQFRKDHLAKEKEKYKK